MCTDSCKEIAMLYSMSFKVSVVAYHKKLYIDTSAGGARTLFQSSLLRGDPFSVLSRSIHCLQNQKHSYDIFLLYGSKTVDINKPYSK